MAGDWVQAAGPGAPSAAQGRGRRGVHDAGGRGKGCDGRTSAANGRAAPPNVAGHRAPRLRSPKGARRCSSRCAAGGRRDGLGRAGACAVRWATRPGCHVDRAACAWVLRRFVDPDAEFVFVEDPTDAPDDATPFAMRGVELSHHNGDCTFETMLRRYDLDDPVLWELA